MIFKFQPCNRINSLDHFKNYFLINYGLGNCCSIQLSYAVTPAQNKLQYSSFYKVTSAYIHSISLIFTHVHAFVMGKTRGKILSYFSNYSARNTSKVGGLMKWIKYYCNADTSLKLQALMDDSGIEGYGRYWLLLGLLGEKFDGEDTKIKLHFREISGKVRIKFSKKLETFLEKLVNFSLLTYKKSGNFYEFEAPILLELQDREFKRARKRREQTAAEPRYKNKKKIKIKNKNKEACVFSFDEAFGVVSKKILVEGSKARERFAAQIKTQDDFDNLILAGKNYVAFLERPENSWRNPKTSFETFLGTKQSGFFWRQFVKVNTGSDSNWEKYVDWGSQDAKG